MSYSYSSISSYDSYDFNNSSNNSSNNSYDDSNCINIHQTWKSHNVPEHLKKQVRSWREQNPNCRYKLWDDKECYLFIKDKFPDFLKTYNLLNKPVMKADLFRYLVVYHYGGVYADIDT